MQTFPAAEAYDYFATFAERIGVELPDQDYASVQAVLEDILERLKKLENPPVYNVFDDTEAKKEAKT